MKKILFTAFAFFAFSLANADEFTVSTVISNPSSVFDNLVVTGTDAIGFTADTEVQIGAVDSESSTGEKSALYQEQIVRTSKTMRFATADDDENAISVVAHDGTYVSGGIFGAQGGIFVYAGGDVFINTGDQSPVNIKLLADRLYAYQAVFNTAISVESIRTTKLSFFGSSGNEIDLGAPYTYMKNGEIHWHKPDTYASLAGVSTTDVYTGWHESTDSAIVGESMLDSQKYRTSVEGTRTESLKYSVSRLRIEPFCKKKDSSIPECLPYYEISDENGFISNAESHDIYTVGLSACVLNNRTLEKFAKEICAGNEGYKCILDSFGNFENFTCQESQRTDSGLFCLYNKQPAVTYTIFKCDASPDVVPYSSSTYLRDKLTGWSVQEEPLNSGVQNLRLVTFQLNN